MVFSQRRAYFYVIHWPFPNSSHSPIHDKLWQISRMSSSYPQTSSLWSHRQAARLLAQLFKLEIGQLILCCFSIFVTIWFEISSLFSAFLDVSLIFLPFAIEPAVWRLLMQLKFSTWTLPLSEFLCQWASVQLETVFWFWFFSFPFAGLSLLFMVITRWVFPLLLSLSCSKFNYLSKLCVHPLLGLHLGTE